MVPYPSALPDVSSPLFVTWKIRLPNIILSPPQSHKGNPQHDRKKDCVAKKKPKPQPEPEEELKGICNGLGNVPAVAESGVEMGCTEILRGCIGTFKNEPVKSALPLYIIISAFNDERFPPISLYEMPYLSCTVSLLQNFEKMQSPNDWEVGKHGLQLSFEDNGTKFEATFLPEVPKEEGWSKKRTITELIRKSGYEGKLRAVQKRLILERYDSVTATTTFIDYLDFVTKNKQYFDKPVKMQMVAPVSDSDSDMDIAEEMVDENEDISEKIKKAEQSSRMGDDDNDNQEEGKALADN